MNVDSSTTWVLSVHHLLPASPDTLLEPLPWMDDALCTQVDPEMFFPEGNGASAAEAKRVCRACPVTTECLQFALGLDPIPAGVWGGLSDRQRRRLRKGTAA